MNRSSLMPLARSFSAVALLLTAVACSPPESYDVVIANGRVVDPETGLAYIEPGSLELSYLWHKVDNTHLSVPGGAGERACLVEAIASLAALREQLLPLVTGTRVVPNREL